MLGRISTVVTPFATVRSGYVVYSKPRLGPGQDHLLSYCVEARLSPALHGKPSSRTLALSSRQDHLPLSMLRSATPCLVCQSFVEHAYVLRSAELSTVLACFAACGPLRRGNVGYAIP